MQKVTVMSVCPNPASLGLGAEEEEATRLFLTAADPVLPAQSYSSCSAIFSPPPKSCEEGTCSRKGSDAGPK